MPRLPHGTVTLMFTDLVGSTRLLRQLRELYGDVLAEHRRLVRAAAAEHGGVEVGTQGDSFFLAFGSARAAVHAAVAIQRSLLAHTWPENAAVRLRLALHTSEPHTTGDGYVGLGVHRGARICAAGHGGQILLSRSTAGLIEDDELLGIELLDLGEQRFKDLERPERVYQLVVEGLEQRFPPLNTQAPRLPSGTVSFVMTDVHGSTALIAKIGPERYGDFLLHHDRLLAEVLGGCGGRIVEKTGDTVLASFTSAKGALLAAAAVHWVWTIYDWPQDAYAPLRVAVHSAEGLVANESYVGLDVNRAAHICAAAHGDQILVSQTTAAVVDRDDLGELELTDLGDFAVRGFTAGVRLFQLVGSGLREAFPPLGTVQA